MAALVLGLMLASAKSSLRLAEKPVRADVRQDRHARPGARPLRTGGAPRLARRLRVVVDRMLKQIWPESRFRTFATRPATSTRPTRLYDKHQEPRPRKPSTEKTVQALRHKHGRRSRSGSIGFCSNNRTALDLDAVSRRRRLLAVQSSSPSFGLFTPPPAGRRSSRSSSVRCQVAGALFLILELDRPFDGMIRFPARPFAARLDPLDA